MRKCCSKFCILEHTRQKVILAWFASHHLIRLRAKCCGQMSRNADGDSANTSANGINMAGELFARSQQCRANRQFNKVGVTTAVGTDRCQCILQIGACRSSLVLIIILCARTRKTSQLLLLQPAMMMMMLLILCTYRVRCTHISERFMVM